LLELLVVIGIIALLATMGIGALRGFNAVNVVQAGNRQLMDDINMARNYAINKRTTVYMVFVPALRPFPLASLTDAQMRRQLTNRISGQYTSYNFVTTHSPGDQPGKGTTNYLAEWKHLPAGVFISTNEFLPLISDDWLTRAATDAEANLPFARLPVPFPTADSPPVDMPCVAFDYRGRLIGPNPLKPRQVDEMITLTRGSLILDQSNGRFTLDFPEIIETPKDNRTNNPYVRIDWITGRVRIEEPKIL
jgi:type II secretory pathway pseudopilin PulG